MSNKNKRRYNSGSVKNKRSSSHEVVEKKAKVSATVEKENVKIGSVFTFGQNDVGQLGLSNDIIEKGRPAKVNELNENCKQICCGGMHTLSVQDNGTVLSFGCDDEGALGREADDENCFSPMQVNLPPKVLLVSAGDSHSAALLEDGRLFAWGSFRDSSGSMGLTEKGVEKLPVQLLSSKTIIKIASGGDHLVILTNEHQLYTCGYAEQGQLGRVPERSSTRSCRQGLLSLLSPGLVKPNLRNKSQIVDIWATTYCTFVQDKSGYISAFGLNNFHQLGLPNSADNLRVFRPTRVESFREKSEKWLKICGGEHHTIALADNGKVFCLGRKEYGRLGLGDKCEDAVVPTLVKIPNDEKCIDVACGTSVSFAVTESGLCYAWGFGSHKQLARGDNEDDSLSPSLVVGKSIENKSCIMISAGGQHAALLMVPKLTNGLSV